MSRAASAEVVVIGAGVSGLVVAQKLSAAGVSVALLEARPRVGGRLLSHTSEHGLVDLGATWRWPNEPRVQALVAALGLGSFPHYEGGDALLDEATVRRLGERAPLGSPSRFAGGAALLATTLAEQLPADVLRLSVVASAVAETADGVAVTTSEGVVTARTAVVLALPPALAASSLAFTPPLPPPLAAAAAGTSTHMAGCVKTIVRFSTPFWRTAGLSGSAFSSRGPMSEVHDHCGPDGSPAALLGFSSRAPTKAEVVAQLARLFGADAASPLEITSYDWSADAFTAVPPGAPPQRLGMGSRVFSSAGAMGGRLLWTSTETAATHAGHIEGALVAAERTVEAVKALLVKR